MKKIQDAKSVSDDYNYNPNFWDTNPLNVNIADIITAVKERAKKFNKIRHAKNQATQSAMLNVMNSTTNNLDARLRIAASGDAASDDRVWVKGFLGNSKQKGDNPATTKHFGGTVGLDFEVIEDTLILGAAYTNARIKADVPGDVDVRANVNLGSIYGRYDIMPNLFLSGNASYGKADIKGLAGVNTKKKADIFKTQANLGYKIALADDFTLTPKVGVSYDYIKVKSLGKSTRVTTDASASLAKKIVVNGITFTPEVNAGVSYVAKQKDISTQVAALQNAKKAPKTSYNLGTSIAFENSNHVNLQLGYDFNFKKQYKAHSGFAKLEVKF